jgi:hypothetical protein
MTDERHELRDANRDPITGEPGSHPIGTGIGAAAGGMAAGAAVGTVAGPIGTVVGAAVGAVVGGLAGKAAGEALDPTAEETYWKKRYVSEPYYQPGFTYDDYSPAYRTGYEGRVEHVGRKFDDVENALADSYNRTKGASKLGWEKAKEASRAAWNRVESALPGDSDRDGR